MIPLGDVIASLQRAQAEVRPGMGPRFAPLGRLSMVPTAVKIIASAVEAGPATGREHTWVLDLQCALAGHYAELLHLHARARGLPVILERRLGGEIIDRLLTDSRPIYAPLGIKLSPSDENAIRVVFSDRLAHLAAQHGEIAYA